MTKKSITLLILLAISVLSFARKPINYEHKSIRKTIGKSLKAKTFEMQVIAGMEKDMPEGKFFTLLSNNAEVGYAYIGRVDCCRAGGCSADITQAYDGNAEYFDFVVCFTPSGAVSSIKVYNYMATHGYEVTAKGWLKQFIGYNGTTDLRVGKEVDSISGATISVNSLTACVEYITSELKTRP